MAPRYRLMSSPVRCWRPRLLCPARARSGADHRDSYLYAGADRRPGCVVNARFGHTWPIVMRRRVIPGWLPLCTRRPNAALFSAVSAGLFRHFVGSAAVTVPRRHSRLYYQWPVVASKIFAGAGLALLIVLDDA